ncbi:hypothetical protein ASF23_17130 [Curtobacterium sp. Leaf261]|nr:hypothetical protein ASF23_17130 [Curtobacterium sp. Leaf261]
MLARAVELHEVLLLRGGVSLGLRPRSLPAAFAIAMPSRVRARIGYRTSTSPGVTAEPRWHSSRQH